MLDARFLEALGPLSVSDLARLTGAVLADPAAGDRPVLQVAPLGEADSGSVGFLANRKHLKALAETRAGACFISRAFADEAPAGCAVLITDRPQAAWVAAAQALHRPVPHDPASGRIHPTAVIGARTTIASDAIIGPGVHIGRDCVIGPHVSVAFALIGDRVTLSAGARIGESGFGTAKTSSGPVDVPQLGRVIIQDGVSVGANSCIDRGSWSDTVIGENSKLDNLVHIAHNVVLGRGCLLAGQTGIAGSSILGDEVQCGGRAGIADHIVVGDRAIIGGCALVTKDVPAGQIWSGHPARPMRQWLKETAWLARMASGKGVANNEEEN